MFGVAEALSACCASVVDAGKSASVHSIRRSDGSRSCGPGDSANVYRQAGIAAVCLNHGSNHMEDALGDDALPVLRNVFLVLKSTTNAAREIHGLSPSNLRARFRTVLSSSSRCRCSVGADCLRRGIQTYPSAAPTRGSNAGLPLAREPVSSQPRSLPAKDKRLPTGSGSRCASEPPIERSAGNVEFPCGIAVMPVAVFDGGDGGIVLREFRHIADRPSAAV